MSASPPTAPATGVLWFDLTTSYNWHRPPAGIIRVEQECCRHLLVTQADRIRLCVFDRDANAYFEITQAQAWAILNRVWPSTATRPAGADTVAATAAPGRAKRLDTHLKNLARRLLAMTPDRYRQSLKHRLVTLRRVMAFAYHEFRAMPQSTPAPGAAPATGNNGMPGPRVSFQAQDTYLTMGLDWDHGKLSYLYPAKRKAGFRVCCVGYDIIPILFPHFYGEGADQFFARYFADLAWLTDHICCISQRTRDDLTAFYARIGSPAPAMSVVRLGDTLPEIAGQEISDEVRELVGTRFVLTVSTIEIRKNHDTLYKAWLNMVEEAGDDIPTLVCVGMPGWRVTDLLFSLQHDPRIRGRVRILNRVSDAELALLYQHCQFTVYPSLYEGWGLPVAESLARGKFCITSNAGSLPEVGGDLVEYLHPWDITGWSARILAYSRDPALLAQREADIRARYTITSWSSTADAIVRAALSPVRSEAIHD
jgi:glycosyltransferase involved in cell wall biosynthesis